MIPRISQNIKIVKRHLPRHASDVAMNCYNLNAPDVNTLVERATGNILCIWTKGYAVHGFQVPSKFMDTSSPFYVP